MAVYPNPSAGNAIMVSGVYPNEPLSIFSADGKLIKELNTADSKVTQVKTSDLQPGIYVLKNGTQHVRFVVAAQ